MNRNQILLLCVFLQFVIVPSIWADDGRHLSVEDFADYSLTSLSNKVREIEDNNDRLSLENDVLRQKITVSSQELASLSGQEKQHENELNQQDTEKELFLLESKLERLQQDFNETSKENQSLQDKLQAQQRQEQSYVEQISSLKSKQTLNPSESFKKENNKNPLPSKEKLKNLVREQQSILAAKDKELALLTQKLIRPKADLNQVKVGSNLLKQKIAMLNDEMIVLKNEENSLSTKLDALTNHSEAGLSSLNNKRLALEQELTQLQETLTKVKNKLGNRPLSGKVDDSETQNLKESLNTIIKEKSNLQKEIAVLESKLTEAQIAH